MAKLSEDQQKVMLLLDDANVDPELVSMNIVRELIELGLIGKSGKTHLELTNQGETVIKRLQRMKR